MINILFGAGNILHLFFESKAYEEIKKEKLLIYDNNKELPSFIGGIKRIDSLNDSNEKIKVIITCAAVLSVHMQCIESGIDDIYVFDRFIKKVIPVREYYINHNIYYCNYKQYKFKKAKEESIRAARENFNKSHDLYSNITEIAIMLSNLCNYSHIHTKCPASCFKKKEIMSSKLVYRLFDELAEDNYKGVICFHIYNEPLMDPRLFMFIQHAKRVMPDCIIRLYSNAYYLDNTMVREIEDIGVDVLETTAYGKQEYERLIDLDVNIAFSTFLGNLDDRMDYYTKPNKNHIIEGEDCNTFLAQVPIYSDGEIGTCCLDYKHPYELGNITKKSLKECLSDEKIINFQLELINGDRTRFPICMNCNWKRGII